MKIYKNNEVKQNIDKTINAICLHLQNEFQTNDGEVKIIGKSTPGLIIALARLIEARELGK